MSSYIHPSLSVLADWDAIEPAAPAMHGDRLPQYNSQKGSSGGGANVQNGEQQGAGENNNQSPATTAVTSTRGAKSTGSPTPQQQQQTDASSSAALIVNRYLEEVDAEIAAIKAASTASVPTAPKEKTKDRAMAIARSLVSQKKVRFQQDGFDLDLTYITPKIIAMGFPSHGRESYYRNPIDEVEKFFEQRHAGHFRIYNLCSERDYEGNGRFGGRYKRFPFDDHNAPCPIRLIPDMMRDSATFLEEDEANVVAIHCKAGKGRTGLMISCLLMHLDPSLKKSADALQFFGDVRTADGKGVTIPSQMRYVRYWETMQASFQCKEPPRRVVHLKSLQIQSMIRPGGPVEIYFLIQEKGKVKLESKKLFPQASKNFIVKTDAGEGYEYTFPPVPTSGGLEAAQKQLTNVFSGDLKFIFYQQNRLFKDEELFHFWLNTSLLKEQEVLPKIQLDKACKDCKKHSDYCADLQVSLDFEILHTDAPVQGDKAGAAAGRSSPVPQKKGLFGRLFS